MKICVVGLGYVGLPLALQAALKGHEVIGVDKKQEVVDLTNAGKSHIREDFLLELFSKTSIKAQTSVVSADAYIICVPTPVDAEKEPDLSLVRKATADVASVLSDGELVVIESTIYPGVCEEIVAPVLDETGKKYLLAHCPERINPGDPKWHVDNIPRVIGGVDRESTAASASLYRSIIDAEVTELSQIRAAEATKILENTFRDVNIAFVNEMAQSFYRMGIDVAEVIRGASSKPFGFLSHYPGMGVGGHCIAVDPYYMIRQGKKKGYDHVFLKAAREINAQMPRWVANMLQNRLNALSLPVKGTRIAVLGLAYKPGVADDRESPSYDLIKILKAREADLVVYDPYLLSKSDVDSLAKAVADADCVVVATAHDEFCKDMSVYKDVKLVIDGRNCLDREEIESFGCMYRGVGRGA